MPFANWLAFALALLLASPPASHPPRPAAVHQQRYCMGTMFDIIAYHPSRAEAEQAVEKAMREIFRLDDVMSGFKAGSELSRLNREGRAGFVSVDRSLYEVIEESLNVSRRSHGTFDVTIAPLLKVWKDAQSDGRRASAEEVAAAKSCVGYQQIEMAAPDRVRFRSECLQIDLGGIGKGYAVDRAVAVLASAGIRSALVNAGGSSIAAIGTPPGAPGWPVQIGPDSTSRTLLLRDRSMSTSQQNGVPMPFTPGTFGDILDPRSGAPSEAKVSVSVVAASATTGDALSTAVLILSQADGARLLAEFGDVSAVWVSEDGELTNTYRESGLLLSESR